MTLDHIEELINPEGALRVYDQVFTTRTGDDVFFTSRIPKTGVVLAAPPQSAFADQWKQIYRGAFRAAVKMLGEDAFYFSLTTRTVASYKAKHGFEKEFHESIHHGTLPTSPYVERTTPIINDWIYPLSIDWNIDAQELTGLDYAVYSLRGTWGLWFCADDFMIIGGPEEFVDTFFSRISSTVEEMIFRFIATFRSEERAWNYFSKLFGEEKTLVYKAKFTARTE